MTRKRFWEVITAAKGETKREAPRSNSDALMTPPSSAVAPWFFVSLLANSLDCLLRACSFCLLYHLVSYKGRQHVWLPADASSLVGRLQITSLRAVPVHRRVETDRLSSRSKEQPTLGSISRTVDRLISRLMAVSRSWSSIFPTGSA